MLNTGVDPYLYGIPLESFCEWLSPFVRLPLQEVVENHIVARANLSVLGQVLFPPGIAVAEVFMPEDGPHCLSLFCDYRNFDRKHPYPVARHRRRRFVVKLQFQSLCRKPMF